MKFRKQRVRAPEFVSPMKATLIQGLPTGAEWLYEVKWDGYRALAVKHGDSVRLLSLKNKNLTTDFPAVVKAIRGLAADTVLIDGEIVAIDKRGCPSFQMLQHRASLGRDWQIVYYAFDLLELEGEDLKSRPLSQRKKRLQQVISGSEIRYNAELPGSADAVVRIVKEAGLEGVIAKRRDSIYRGSTRSTDWLKLKLEQSQEFVIGGYNPNAGSFQSILAGYYEGDKLMFAGKVRQGLNPASRAALFNKMKRLITVRCPFCNLPTSKKSHFGEGITADEMKKLRWLEPQLVVEVRFTEWTSYGLLRHATFAGLRDDKEPGEVTREQI
jgi:bifunctional non-homologous end joining protein LigD